ncbi:MAG: alkylation response protein AidB-like acyl-CoA dehydrogenase [Parvibaculaceae bacterium]|jgi:alkylation response protein AidB-like acyl-CoA dehydrogenase|nr:acyl-CoA/acyl-ACP dehydrogenase [Parvibaculaceae bacterium]
MEFALSEEQKMLQDSVGRFLETACPLDVVRAVAEKGALQSDDVWRGLVDLGVPGMMLPETYGGMAFGVLEAALVSEMMGRHVAAVPFIGACVMGPLAIARGGSDALKEAWLPKIAAGDVRVGVAFSEHTGAREDAGIKVEGGRLSGRSLFVIDGGGADIFVVADTQGGLHLIEAEAEGVERIALTSIDRTRSLSELRLTNVASQPLDGGKDVLASLIDAGRILYAADTLGAGWAMIDQAVAYAKERKQFNRVIGSFQSVKHLCAEMAAELEPCRSLVWYAAHSQDALPEDARLTAGHAKSHLSEVGRFVARTATEVHGGMGFTDLLGLHYWFKRIGVNRQLLGSPERVRQELARLQGWAA